VVWDRHNRIRFDIDNRHHGTNRITGVPRRTVDTPAIVKCRIPGKHVTRFTDRVTTLFNQVLETLLG
jgi:hypothetical protein